MYYSKEKALKWNEQMPADCWLLLYTKGNVATWWDEEKIQKVDSWGKVKTWVKERKTEKEAEEE